MNESSTRRIARIAALSAVMAALPTPAFALSGTNEHVDAFFNLPAAPDGGYYSIDTGIHPTIDPAPIGSTTPAYYYSSDWHFAVPQPDGTKMDACGYMGLQTDRNGKRAIFSIWGATGATAYDSKAYAEPFTEISCPGFDGGWHIMMDYPLATDHYTLRIWQLESRDDGVDYGAWVVDTDTNEERMLGTITVPPTWAGLESDVVMFSEWYGGDFPSCSALPQSSVIWSAPTANGGDAQATYSGYVDVAGACPGVGAPLDDGIWEVMPANR